MPHRVLVVQHQDSCPPALVGQWLADAGLQLDVRRPDLGQALPVDLDGQDALLVLGGTMDAVDEAGHPWLADTVALLRDAVARSVPTLGICLGHQLLARACGGVVDRNPRGRQLGVLPLGWTAAAASDRLVGPMVVAATAHRAARGLQWNQDIVVDLPPDAVVLARTSADEPQLVRFGPAAWGIQAHPEVDRGVVQQWADDPDSDVEPAVAARVVAAVEVAAEELSGTWRPFARRFAELAAAGRGPGAS